jgi:hypothetical protein
MDLLQTTIVIVLIILTAVTTCVGVYFVFILKELRETVRKTNGVLDDVKGVTGAISSPVATFAGIINGITESLKTVKSVNSLFEGKKKGKK